MNDIWQRLNLTPTTDKKVIQKAYREALRDCHPETDPDGFAYLRQCYEDALDYAKQQTAPEQTHASHEHHHVNSSSREIPVADHALIQNDLTQLIDAFSHTLLTSDWCNLAIWNKWFDAYHQHSITDQMKLSEHGLSTVLRHRWLPAPLVQYFYTAFDWQQLQFGNEQDKEMGEYLEQWASEQFPLSPEIFASLSYAEQRGLLTVINPLIKGLHYCHIDALHYFLMQSGPYPLLTSPHSALIFLRALKAIERYPHDYVLPVLDGLTSHNTSELSDDDLALCCMMARQCRHDALFRRIASLLEDRQLYTILYPELQAFWGVTDKNLGLCFAILAQESRPQNGGFWAVNETINSLINDEKPDLSSHWLASYLAGEAYPMEAPFVFDYHQGICDCFAYGFWLSQFGCWQAIQSFIQILPELSSDKSPGERLLLNHLQKLLEKQLVTNPFNEELATLFQLYGQDEWFTSDTFRTSSLTDAHIDALTTRQWSDIFIRHPLLPGTWIRQLNEHKKLDYDHLSATPLIPTFIEQFFYNQIKTDADDYPSAWHYQMFTGCFNWAFAYLSHCTFGFRRATIHEYVGLSQLPAHLVDSDLYQLAPLIRLPQKLYECSIDEIRDLPLTVISGYLTFSYVDYYEHKIDTQTCYENALKGHPISALMLANTLIFDDFDDAVVAYNIAKSFEPDYPNLSISNLCFYNTLRSQRQKLGLALAEYDMREPEILHIYVENSATDFIEFDELKEIDASQSAENYHYPMCLILSYIHGGSQLNHTPAREHLRKLKTPKTPFDETRGWLVALVLKQFEQRVQQKLQQDINEKGKHAITYSKQRLGYLALLNVVILWFTSSSLEHFEFHDNFILITGGISLVGQLALTLRMGMLQQHFKGLCLYFITFCIPIAITLLTGNSIGCWIGLIAQILYIIVLPDCNLHGGWSEKAYNIRQITVDDFI